MVLVKLDKYCLDGWTYPDQNKNHHYGSKAEERAFCGQLHVTLV